MREKKILEDIKVKNTFQADNEIFEKILSDVAEYDREIMTSPSRKRSRILRPAIVFYVLVFVIASTFAATAAVNEDVREYLISIFGGNPNSVDGELVDVTAQSDGVEMTVDAVVAEGDSLFMIYTLRDKEHKVFSESTSINAFKFKVGNDQNYSANYNTIIKNGEKNYMVLYSDGIKKGVQKVQFSLESLRTPDPAKEFAIPAGTTNYKPDGIPGYVIDYVKLKDNRIQAAINITNGGEYIHNFNIRVQNTKTGEYFHQKGETTEGDSESKTRLIKWYSEELDNGNEEDYRFILSFDKVYTFEEPLIADFSVDFSRKPLKLIYPDDTRVLTAVVEKVTVHQMSIVADLRETKPAVHEDKPIPVSEESETLFLEETKAPGIPGQRMTVRYEDGTQADAISASISSNGPDKYRFYLVLNGALDYSRKPTLLIGEAEIPLY